jgi:hypothetical protein
MGKALTPFITSSFWATVLVGLVVLGTLVVIVPLLTSFVVIVVSSLAPVYNLVACSSRGVTLLAESLHRL